MGFSRPKDCERALAVIVIVLLVMIGSCGGESSQDPIDCVPVGREVLDDIESGLDVSGTGVVLRGQAVRSEAFSRLYFVAVEIRAPGMDRALAVFATNSLTGDGTYYAVDNMADEFSVFPFGRDTDANIRMTDHGAREAQQCLTQ